ncbi:flagellar hook-basal body complex protein FliE [Microbaculum marinisediminis]|uniref:Flagellar hook-basal body complex protein FliE n=1 Tax=Microbaculum marinisediminis TaxID=2931392 RepID=A0AAW5R247_9HYPH|nr:flagellar hook-basal body complex protein FliE [Microbaculum sp. A6E488]MCT8972620.1 flagellar hook-basal body complex protein FliE [Microbaculum sp. A6E488]
MTPAAAIKAYAAAADAAMTKAPGTEKTAGMPDFGEMLGTAMTNVVEQGRAAEQTSVAALTGGTDPVNVVTAVAETELALETMVSIRDKVIAAYEEILRMPI